jgi:hypothetical protein
MTLSLEGRMGLSRPQWRHVAFPPGINPPSPLRDVTAFESPLGGTKGSALVNSGRWGLPQWGHVTASVLSCPLQSGHLARAMCTLSVDGKTLAILQIQAERELVRFVGHVSIQIRGVGPHSNRLLPVVEFEKPQIATSACVVSRALIEPLVI